VPANPYRGYRFPEEIISQCVWLYFNFAVSLREVELMMAYRGVQLEPRAHAYAIRPRSGSFSEWVVDVVRGAYTC